MNGNYLLDTNIILGFLKGTPSCVQFFTKPEIQKLYVSVISRMELLSFHGITAAEEKSINAFLELTTLVPLDNEVQEIAIRLRRESKRKMPDAIVAASAIRMNATLVTCDQQLAETHFTGLHTHNPDK